MNYSHLLEAGMLVCFGFSWPINVIKSYKSGTAKGTSLTFIFLIIIGYIAGISAKIINKQFNYVLAVYFINLAIVMLNIFVYFRNKKLDKTVMNKKENNIIKIDSKNIQKKVSEEHKTIINLSQEEFYQSKTEKTNTFNETCTEKNCVVLIGGTTDKQIPVNELAANFDFNFPLYNKSTNNLSIKNAKEYFEKNILPLQTEAIIMHIGEQDLNLFGADTQEFDALYISLIETIKNSNKKERIALISINNPTNNKIIESMNLHIKAIADSELCTFVNLDEAKLWNPEATKAANDFAYSMGLSVRKPLKNVAEILYSYAYNNLHAEDEKLHLIG